jgi:hypothetical protein
MPLATPEELLRYPPPPLPAWIKKPYRDYAGPPLLPSPDYQIQFLKPASKGGKPGEAYFYSNPGSQTHVLMCPYDEIVIGGSRGGAKSMALIAWMAMGDPFLTPDDPARYSFLLDPSYRGLLLRKEYSAMTEFTDECAEFFGPLGGKGTGDPLTFTFKSGAKIYCNHLGDKNAYEKFRGWALSRIGVEELTQIEEERWYLKLLGSLRAKRQIRVHGNRSFPKLRSQIMSTTNPDGPGRIWVARRFVKVLDGKGNRIPPNTPMRDIYTGMTRIFIPMWRRDNPFLRNDKSYEGKILAQDIITQKQWSEGDWEAQEGVFFTTYRPQGPVGEQEQKDTPWARHIPVETPKLKPWWFRWGSLDIGYDHPATSHKFCRNTEDKRVHVYDELSVRHMDSYEIGVLIAKWWVPELEVLPDHQIVLYLSPDAFSKTDGAKTRAEQLEMGIKEVLGPYGAIMLRFNEQERNALLRDSTKAAAMFNQRKSEFNGKMGIAIKSANNDRKAGCDYINSLLRFRPTFTETQEQLSVRLADVYGRSGLEAYEKARATSKVGAVEILPKIQIWPVCKGLDRCFRQAVRGEAPKNEEYVKFDAVNGIDGDDELDDLRYGVMGYKEVETTIPKEYFVGDRMSSAQAEHVKAFGEELTDPTRLVMIQQRQAAIYDRQHPAGGGGLYIPRASSQRHRTPHNRPN